MLVPGFSSGMLAMLQGEIEAAAAARDLADQSVKAAADSKSAEEEQRAARQAADAQLAHVQSQLEEAQRARQKAQEQQHSAEEVLSVKLALLQSMAQRFAQAGEAKRKAAELQVKAQERIASADEDMRALGQQLMYAAAGKLQSNSHTKTACQGETSGGAPTQGQLQATDAQPDNETAILQTAGEAPGDTAAQPDQEVTLQLQLVKASTQHTEQAGLPVIEDTQENVNATVVEAEAEQPAQEDAASPKMQSSSSNATSASTSPSVQSSSKGPGGDENVNNNSMDVDGENGEVVQKPDRCSAAGKAHDAGQKASGTALALESVSLALRLPETAVYEHNTVNNTLDEFDGME